MSVLTFNLILNKMAEPFLRKLFTNGIMRNELLKKAIRNSTFIAKIIRLSQIYIFDVFF